MTSNAVAVPTTESLAPLSQASREAALMAYLTTARDQLAHALEVSGAESVAAVKAEIATAADATRHLGLSKEIQADAMEMVRRAEYTLGKAVRKEQGAGTVTTRADGPAVRDLRADRTKLSARDIFGGHTHEQNFAMLAADEATDEQFETALNEAREEGNQSRANVVRKIKGQKGPQTRGERINNKASQGGFKRTRAQLADEIEVLATKGHTYAQIAHNVGVGEEWVRITAHDYGLNVPAERVMNKARRVNSNRVMESVAESVSTAAFALRQINPEDLDTESAQEWIDSLTESITALRKAVQTIKESIQ